jgi:hypothetical protein
LTLLALLALYCFLFVSLVDAGTVPRGYRPPSTTDEDVEDGGVPVPATNGGGGRVSAIAQIKRSTGGLRRCAKCPRAAKHASAPLKPPRAHHCRVCGVCRLRMDHHCHFAAACVGHRNYRGYLLLLLYAGLALLHVCALLLGHTGARLVASFPGARRGPSSDVVMVAGGGRNATSALGAAAGGAAQRQRARRRALLEKEEEEKANAAAAAVGADDHSAAFATGTAEVPERLMDRHASHPLVVAAGGGGAAAASATAPNGGGGGGLACAAAELSALALAGPACVGVLWLGWWHLKLVLANKTTVEHVEGVAVRPVAPGGAAVAPGAAAASSPAPAARAARLAAAAAMSSGSRAATASHHHPWDLGPWRNLQSVLGPSPWLWLVPPIRPAAGGLSFRSRWD